MPIFNQIKTSPLLLILLLLTPAAYSKNQPLTPPIASNQIQTYFEEDYNGETHLLSQYTKQLIPFTPQELTIPIKRSLFESETQTNPEQQYSATTHYYLITQYQQNNNIFKLIVYDPQNHETSLITQLNSYNPQGKLIDALMLDNRLKFEDINRFSEFTIHENDIIDINTYVTVVLLVVEGDIVGEIENPIPEHYQTSQYKITQDGYFELINQKTYPLSNDVTE